MTNILKPGITGCIQYYTYRTLIVQQVQKGKNVLSQTFLELISD
jgi:hypothetical protein